jgi:hypothetical protein
METNEMRCKTKILITIIILFPLSAWAGMLTIAGVAGGNIKRRVVSVREAKYKNIVPQSVDFSCGAASLATLLQHYYGEDVTEREIVEYLLKTGELDKIKQAGFSFLDLKRYVTKLNYKAGGYRLTDYKVLDKLKIPVIVLITTHEYQHFVVLKGIARGKAFIADPIRGNISLSKADFYDAWNGIIFIVLRRDKQPGTSYLALETAVADAPKPQIMKLKELGINNYNNMGLKNLIVFPMEF